MRRKTVYITLMVAVPVLLISFGPIKRKIQVHFAQKELKHLVAAWNSQEFSLITNAVQRLDAADAILTKANLTRLSQNGAEAYSDAVLKRHWCGY